MINTSHFDQVLDDVETLSPAEQIELVEVIWRRLVEQRRTEIKAHVAEANEDYRIGNAIRGSVAELLAEIDS